MKKLLYLLLPALLTVAACSKKDNPTPAPVPAAVASFTMARTVAEVNEPVQLTNTSAGAVRYEWRSSDNPSSINVAPNTVFSNATPGAYTITLTAYNSAGVPATSTQTIRIGRRYIVGLRVNQLNFFNANGQPWDSGSGPDVFFRLSRAGAVVATGNPFNNLTSAQLPVGWTLASLNLEATGPNWGLAFIETGNLLGDVSMANFTIDESVPPTNRDANGTGTKTGTSNGWQIETLYETR